MAAWREAAPELELVALAMSMHGDADEVDMLLAGHDLTGATAFVTYDAMHLNFARLERMGLFRVRGLRMPPLVCRGAIVSDNAKIGENCYVGPGAIVGQGCTVGFNCVVGASALIGHGTSIGNSCWVEDGVIVGRATRIGAHVTLGGGVVIGNGVQIGKLCVIDRPGRVDQDVATRTFLHASHAHPMVIVGA